MNLWAERIGPGHMSMHGSVGGRWSWEPRVLHHLTPNGGRPDRGIVAAYVVVYGRLGVELVAGGGLCFGDTTEIVLLLGAVPRNVSNLFAFVALACTSTTMSSSQSISSRWGMLLEGPGGRVTDEPSETLEVAGWERRHGG